MSITASIEHWLICHDLLLEDLSFIKRYVLFKYEDLVLDPIGHATQIADLLGVSQEFDMTTIRPGVNNAYFERWKRLRKPPSRNLRRLGVVVNRLLYGENIGMIDHSRAIEDVQTRFEEAINRFGYSFSDDSFQLPANSTPGRLMDSIRR
jgi:hypothetical protein